MAGEFLWLYAGLALYGAAAAWAVFLALRDKRAFWGPLGLVAMALLCHGAAILLRWARLDHGPYVDLFEILSSNIWSLHLALLLSALMLPPIRASLAVSLPLLQVLVLWLLVVPAQDSAAPVTYDTVWLAVHVWLGKAFLGCIVVAVGISLVVLFRGLRHAKAFQAMPDSFALDELIYRLVLIAFLFESLMLVAGAIWAQDAWGRYWAWDPLETWAFVTWLGVIGYLHLRFLRRPAPVVGALLVLGIFVIAFSTFFGMPFISTSPHKGAI